MIWCVEDDASIRDIEVYTLSSTGFDARGFEDGVSFWSALQTEKPDLVVLDVMLPGVDGIELLQRMKASAELRTIPVVMATAKGAEYDKIRGLDLGADYYLVKPFGVMELVSCVKAVLRRCQPEKAAHQLRSGGLVVDLDAHTVTVDGARVLRQGGAAPLPAGKSCTSAAQRRARRRSRCTHGHGRRRACRAYV